MISLQAEGLLAISRWLSAATPPVHERNYQSIPEGCQHKPNKGTDMSSTFISLHYHIVFSTKHRTPIIDAVWRERLHEYLGGTVNGLKGFSQGVGGTEDHVHLFAKNSLICWNRQGSNMTTSGWTEAGIPPGCVFLMNRYPVVSLRLPPANGS